MLDFHNHLIPGVDDGAASIVESRAALAQMRSQGIEAIITTPHLSASSIANGSFHDYFRRIDAAWVELRQMAEQEFPSLNLKRGFEILIDAPRVNYSDPRFRLADSRFMLVEFPWGGVPAFAPRALFDIKSQGYQPIVAHPERYSYMDRDLTLAEEWVRAGALLQINEGSLIGNYGERTRSLAWKALERGIASYLCSDFHARGICPAAAATNAVIQQGEDWSIVQELTQVNPFRVLDGLDPQMVAPLRRPRKTLLTRLRRAWRRLT